jgi:RNA polymerase sigma-70 factor (ECF subfamily)
MSPNDTILSDASAQADAALLGRVAIGDRDAFAALYDRFSKPLFSFALRIVGNPADAEDVLQEVFVQIWEKAGQFDPSQGKPFTWSVTMTRNKAIDRLRSSQRRHRLVEEATLADPASDVVETGKAIGTDEATRIRTAVNTLPTDQRQAIEMAFFGGLTHHQIAEKVSEPLGTIKARIRRGMLKLRDTLEGAL